MTKRKLDKYDRAIIQELIVNPKLNDNKISGLTKIPVKTVSRKRKKLEEEGIINYMVSVNYKAEGTGDFEASIMYIVTFNYGIYRKRFLDGYKNLNFSEKDSKHINFKWLGEKDGHLILILIIESNKFSDILEIYNVEILGKLNSILGPNCIKETSTIPITTPLTYFHNYELLKNIKNGMIKEHWSKNMIFVSDL